MVNGARFRIAGAILLGAAMLIAAAWLRGAEYDEQYTLFLTAGTPRPIWPDTPFLAQEAYRLQAGHSTFTHIATDLRTTDVHPPLYFWAVSVWRDAFGPGLFTARLFSVLCGIASLVLVARLAGPRAVPAILLTTGCYGFVYTNAIARGFAPAETLTLAGMVLLIARRPISAGAAFGAASACNYLAIFIAIAAQIRRDPTGRRSWFVQPLRTLAGAAPFLALDAWFFAAQHGARPNQFPAFEVWPSLMRLAGYQVAAVFGGLPLYWDGLPRIAAGLAVGVATLLLVLRVIPHRGIVLAAAPAAGLLALGAIFNNTPIELRYLSFGLPFIALLATAPGLGRTVILTVQAAGIAGLLLAPSTMQPARAAAAQAALYVNDALILLPAGNDGVGIVGAFAIEAPPTAHLRLIHPNDPPPFIPPQYRRVILALLAQDQDSTASIAVMRGSVPAPNWRQIAIGSKLEVYERGE